MYLSTFNLYVKIKACVLLFGSQKTCHDYLYAISKNDIKTTLQAILFYFYKCTEEDQLLWFYQVPTFFFPSHRKKPSQLNHDHLQFFICTQEHPQKYLYSPQEIKVPGSDFYSHHIQSLEYLPVRLVYRYIKKYHEATGGPLELIKRSCLFFGICEVFLPINTT